MIQRMLRYLLAHEPKRGGFDPFFERVETAEALEGALATKPSIS